MWGPNIWCILRLHHHCTFIDLQINTFCWTENVSTKCGKSPNWFVVLSCVCFEIQKSVEKKVIKARGDRILLQWKLTLTIWHRTTTAPLWPAWRLLVIANRLLVRIKSDNLLYFLASTFQLLGFLVIICFLLLIFITGCVMQSDVCSVVCVATFI